MAKVAINGMGRIGRATFKIALETPELEVVAVNDLVAADNLAYLLGYDTVYGRYGKTVRSADGGFTVEGKRYGLLNEKDPSKLPWKDLGIDIVFECTGRFTKKEDLEKHIQAGAKRAILSTDSKSPLPTIVPGVNQSGEADTVFSLASCTTNCVSPVVEVMGRRIGIKKAIMTTVHAYTATQLIVDGPDKKFRRGRAGALNLVPTSTGAAVATTKVLPQYSGKFGGIGIRVPVPAGSLSDIVFVTERETSVEEVNRIFQEEAESERYQGILGVTEEQLVSSDIIQDPHASLVDLSSTQVVAGDLVKIMTWYDNEWGYSTQMVREAARIARAEKAAKPRGKRREEKAA